MKLLPWLVLLISIAFVSCSGSKSAKKVSEETPQIELTESDEFIENTGDEPVADTSAEAAEAEATAAVDTSDTSDAAEEPVVSEIAAEEPVEIAESTAGGSRMQYTVKKNETLMMIAFKLYGDYGKWKRLANQNSAKLNGNMAVRAGMVLDYVSPAQEFVWNPQGLPYLIRTGDTLGIISKTVYTTPKKWKLIWENNRPLIKDPNKIFAGFTLYYLENGREVASGI